MNILNISTNLILFMKEIEITQVCNVDVISLNGKVTGWYYCFVCHNLTISNCNSCDEMNIQIDTTPVFKCPSLPRRLGDISL